MFQRKKNFWFSLYEKIISETADIYNDNKILQNINSNFRQMITDTSFYKYFGEYNMNGLYIAFSYNYLKKTSANTGYEFELVIRKLDSPFFEKILKADIEVKERSLEVLNIDSFLLHKGHGSKCFEILVKYCKDNNIEKIYGTLWKDTNIGFENLKKFYEKNGCKVYTKGSETYFEQLIYNPHS